MRFWNGYRWTEYSGEPIQGPTLAANHVGASLDPAIKVVTEAHVVPAFEAAHVRHRAEHADTGELARAGAPSAFDTSDEED